MLFASGCFYDWVVLHFKASAGSERVIEIQGMASHVQVCQAWADDAPLYGVIKIFNQY
jgi:hypothetical protein